MLDGLAKRRPEGYVNAIRAVGVEFGEFLEITTKDWQEIQRRFGIATSMPNAMMQAGTAAKAVVGLAKAVVAHSSILTDGTALARRQEACRACKALTDKERCLECGCWMKAKWHLAQERCPIGKW